MTTRSKRKTKRSKNTNYAHYTPSKLLSAAKKWQKKLVAYSKATAKKKINGKTIAAHKAAIQKEMKRIATKLGSATTKQIKAKIKALKTQISKKGHTRSGLKTSPAIKRLTLKYNQFKKSSKDALKLIKLHKGFKLSSFKNPLLKKKKTKAKTTTRRKSTAKRGATKRIATGRKSKRGRAVVSKATKAKASSLKREITKLKQRNSSMKKLVAKFRKEVAQLQRHYGALSGKKTQLRLVHSKKDGKDVNNIVRFSNALNNAVTKQRKAS